MREGMDALELYHSGDALLSLTVETIDAYIKALPFQGLSALLILFMPMNSLFNSQFLVIIF
jgi:hypothetical protein